MACTLAEVRNRIKVLKAFDVFVVSDQEGVIGIIGCPCIDKEKCQFGVEVTLFADVVEKNIASEKIITDLSNYLDLLVSMLN